MTVKISSHKNQYIFISFHVFQSVYKKQIFLLLFQSIENIPLTNQIIG